MSGASLTGRVTARLLDTLREHGNIGIDGAAVAAMTADEVSEYMLGARERFDRVTSSAPLPRDTMITAVQEDAIQGEWICAASADVPERIVMHVHGGGYVMGGPHTHRGIAWRLSRATHGRVWLPRYRLAPEHMHPAGLDDVVASYLWLLEQPSVDPSMVAVSGDSAGGGLSLAMLLRLRDEGLELPACWVGLSPWTDLSMSSPSIRANNGRDALFGEVAPDLLPLLPAMYAADVTDPSVSPLLADLTGLPPMLVHAGSDELIRDDSVRLVEKAREAGVDASLGLFEGMWHVFQAFPIPETHRSMTEIGGFIRRHTPVTCDGGAVDRDAAVHRNATALPRTADDAA